MLKFLSKTATLFTLGIILTLAGGSLYGQTKSFKKAREINGVYQAEVQFEGIEEAADVKEVIATLQSSHDFTNIVYHENGIFRLVSNSEISVDRISLYIEPKGLKISPNCIVQ